MDATVRTCRRANDAGAVQLAPSRSKISSLTLTSAKTRLMVLSSAIVGVTRHFGDGVAYQDHAIIVLNAATHGVGDADACGHACHDAGGNPQVAKDGIEWRIGETAKPLLCHNVLPFTGH